MDPDRRKFIDCLYQLRDNGLLVLQGDLENDFEHATHDFTEKGMGAYYVLDAALSAAGIGRQPYYVANVVVRRDGSDGPDQDFLCIFIDGTLDYEAAVGNAYLEIVQEFPPAKGWVVVSLDVGPDLVWREPGNEEEEEEEGDDGDGGHYGGLVEGLRDILKPGTNSPSSDAGDADDDRMLD